jgi:hypothetical protein
MRKVFNTFDLIYDYEWTAIDGDNPAKKAKDSELFNKKEGYEVVSMIESFFVPFRGGTQEDVTSIEKQLHYHLPGDIRSREKVREWLEDLYVKGFITAQRG